MAGDDSHQADWDQAGGNKEVVNGKKIQAIVVYLRMYTIGMVFKNKDKDVHRLEEYYLRVSNMCNL